MTKSGDKKEVHFTNEPLFYVSISCLCLYFYFMFTPALHERRP